MRVAVFLPNWIGDVVMATPALRALRNDLPEGTQIVGVGKGHATAVLAGTPWLDEILVIGPNNYYDALARVRLLRQRRFDAAVLFTNSFRTALVAFAAGAERRIGYARDLRRWMLTDVLPVPRIGRRRLPISAVDCYLALVETLGCSATSKQLELATTPSDETETDKVWRSLGWSREDSVVVLNGGGAFGPAKHWPESYFSSLARRIVRDLHMRVLVLSGPAERLAARRIVSMSRLNDVASLADHTPSIGLSKACVRRATALVSTDSGPRHFAAAFDVPCVALFGPTHVGWSENYHAREIRLQKSVPCGPCQKKSCPLHHHRCMTELNVDEVFTSLAELLQANVSTPAA